MFSEDELLPLSALQHLAFCERQWALIHLEGVWVENRLTVEGQQLHTRADRSETQQRRDIRIARGLRLRSLRLGLSGRADIVEFHRTQNADAISLPKVQGRWWPIPVEYKRGRVKKTSIDEVQLCAQALCLEEMLGGRVERGFLFYGKVRRRYEVTIGAALRQQTEVLTQRLHDMTHAGKTPSAKYEKKCDRCSLYDVCLPKTTGSARSVEAYMADILRSQTCEEG